MMVHTAATFVQSVLTFYSFYRYILQRDDFFKEILLTYFQWQLYYLALTITVIYTANLLTKEVKYSKDFLFDQNLMMISFSSQGKRTFLILHDIINCCSDVDVPSSV